MKTISSKRTVQIDASQPSHTRNVSEVSRSHETSPNRNNNTDLGSQHNKSALTKVVQTYETNLLASHV